MITSMSITLIAIYVLEAIVIIIGNTFTIFVFWTQTSHLKRSYFLLINLAVADLLVGIAVPIVLATEKTKTPSEVILAPTSPSSAFQLLASSTSVFFLALISLERAFAVLWPIRHRVTSTRTYIYSIAIAWAVGFCMFGLFMLPMYYTKVEWKYVFATIHSCLFISILVICASYLKIRTQLIHSPAPGEFESHNRKSTERNLRLSRTTFFVAAVSLIFWLPAFVVYTVRASCGPTLCFPSLLVSFANALHLANSMVNPFVYSFRMAIFKDALKKLFRRRRRNHIEMASVQANRLGLSAEGSSSPITQHTGAHLSEHGIPAETLKGGKEDHH